MSETIMTEEEKESRSERELAEDRERLRLVLASIGDAVISTDCNGSIVFLNRVAQALTGWPESEAIGASITDVFQLVDESTREALANPGARALSEGRRIVDSGERLLLIPKKGSACPVEIEAAPMSDAEGRTIGASVVFRDMTERRRTEEALARLAAIVESSDDAILSKTLDGVIQSWNAGAERVFGYTADETVGRPITMIIPADRLSEEVSILQRLRRGERIEHFETVRVRKDGRLIHISLTVSPVKDQGGRIIGASKIARDITERIRSEEALRASESRHRFLAELAAATQAFTDPNDVMSTTARMLAEHLGVDRCAYAEIEDESVFAITGDYTRELPTIVGRWPIAAFGAECERCMLANEPHVVDDVDTDERVGSDLSAYRQTNIRAVICVPLHKAGKLAAAMAVHQATPRLWSRAEIELVTTLVGLSWESIERTRVERGLRDTADRLALALSAARLGDWSWNVATDQVRFSSRGAQMFGLSPDEPVTWTELQAMLHDEDREHARTEVERSIARGDQYDVEYRVNRPDGTQVWISAKGRAHYDVKGRAMGMMGLIQDITEKKHLEHELRLRASELSEADKKKDDFIALLAHELRNPLAPVRTGLEVMRLAAGDPKAVAAAQSMMTRQLSHMVRLIDDLLDVSRISRNKLHLQKTRVLLTDVVDNALEATEAAIAADGHSLEVSLPDVAIILDADLTRLAQVFGNLVTNAAKYTDAGGKLSLRAALDGDDVVVRVEDNGIGIPREALPRVFDMFSQVDRPRERVRGGLGIGLALVKALVETHGGSVRAESGGPGKGSVFTVRLPVVDVSPCPELRESTRPVAAARPKRRILVADDNEDAASSIAELLELLGDEVHVAHDGVQAIELAERVRPDVVLMDIGMPHLDGLEVTRRIRSECWGARITIVALTGWGQENVREQSRAAGCDAHLVKPLSLSQLETILADLSHEG